MDNRGFEITPRTGKLKKYDGDDSIVYIPNDVKTISYYQNDGEYYGAFSCEGVVEVYIPDSVTFIDKSAFEDCIDLEIVVFQKNCHIEKIAEYAFANCKKLKKVIFEEGSFVKEILSNAFSDCEKLYSINLPFGLQYIGTSAFANCKNIRTIEFPETLAMIGHSAFEKCEKIESLVIHECRLMNEAFKDCKSLEKIELHQDLIEIPTGAFKGCEALEKVIFKGTSSIETFETESFAGCKSLRSITFPANLKSVKYRAFENCYVLEDINIESKNKIQIADDAFLNCFNINKKVKNLLKKKKDYSKEKNEIKTHLYATIIFALVVPLALFLILKHIIFNSFVTYFPIALFMIVFCALSVISGIICSIVSEGKYSKLFLILLIAAFLYIPTLKDIEILSDDFINFYWNLSKYNIEMTFLNGFEPILFIGILISPALIGLFPTSKVIDV